MNPEAEALEGNLSPISSQERSSAPVKNFLSAESHVARNRLTLVGHNDDGTEAVSKYGFGDMDGAKQGQRRHQGWLENSKGELVGEATIEETERQPGQGGNIRCFITVDGEKLSFNYSQPERGTIDSKGVMYRIATKDSPLAFGMNIPEGRHALPADQPVKVQVYKVSADHPSKTDNWRPAEEEQDL